MLDVMVCSVTAAIMILNYIYMEPGNGRWFIFAGCVIITLFFLILAMADTDKKGAKRKSKKINNGKKRSICSLVLLDENNQALTEWNIAGKISILIGRDTQKENVDINLMNTAFGGMVDRQHAVMNYTSGQWYIEDLDSTNGIRIQKRDQKIYEISKRHPCLVEKGDILIIGLTKLAAK